LPKAYKSHLAKNNINVAANIRTELASQLKSKGIQKAGEEDLRRRHIPK